MKADYIDLHSHWICGIDDGARTLDESVALLSALAELGFGKVIATPHMRPDLFDNHAADLKSAYEDCLSRIGAQGLPTEVGLACEHYLDDIVYQRIIEGKGVPYPGEKAILIECYGLEVSRWWARPLAALVKQGLRPIIAHPERYHALWKHPADLDTLRNMGASALLDVATLSGHYGERPLKCAERLLELDLYDAACSDAHRVDDIDAIGGGITELRRRFGHETAEFLLKDGPEALLRGNAPA